MTRSARESPAGGGRRSLALGLLVFAAALTVRVGYLAAMQQSPYYQVALAKGADSYRFFEWALSIYNGDIFGKGVFIQSPLYPYFLALTFRLSEGGHLLVPRLVQAVMASGTALMCFLLARRFRGDAAGVIAGLLAALYGPMIFYDAAFLRTGLTAFLYTLLVVLMTTAQNKPGLARGAVTGLVFGLSVLAKPNIAIMILAVPLWFVYASRNKGRAAAGKMTASALAAFALVMGLLVFRNVMADAPPFSLTKRGALEFVAGNHPEGMPYGWEPTPAIQRMTEEADGSLAKAVPAVLWSYRHDPLALIGKQLAKTRAYLYGYEAPNNLNYYVEKRYVNYMDKPWVNWPVLLGLAAVGLWALRREWPRALALYSYILLFSLGTIAFYFLARFRLPAVPVLCVCAGAGVVELHVLVRQRKTRAFLALAAVMVTIVLVSWPREGDLLQPSDYHNLARYHMIVEEPEKARSVVEEGKRKAIELAGGDGAFARYRVARMRFLGGEPLDDVLAEIEKARAEDPEPWIEALLTALERNAETRKRFGDFQPGGFRFFHARPPGRTGDDGSRGP